MKRFLICISATALVSTLSACGGADKPANEVANDINVMATAPDAAPAAPTAAHSPVTPTARPTEPREAAPKPAAPKPVPAEPAPKPSEPKMAEPKAAEPKAPDTSCLPEHRAAGHC